MQQAEAEGGLLDRAASWCAGKLTGTDRLQPMLFAALGVWLAVLFLDFAWVRLLAQSGIPVDAWRCGGENNHECGDTIALMDTYREVFGWGCLLALVVGLHHPERFHYVFEFRPLSLQRGSFSIPRGVVFVSLVLATSLGWASLDFLPVLKYFSLTAGGVQGIGIALLVVIGFCGVLLVLFHLWLAWRFNTKAGVAAYVCSRLVFAFLYALYIIYGVTEPSVYVHVHHYNMAWLAGMLAEFNHPVSFATLAVAKGSYVQGLGNYHADPVLTQPP